MNIEKRFSPPPSDKLIEQALIGSLLIDSTILEEFFSEAQVEWFYHYKELIELIFQLGIEGKDVDLISLKARLEEKNLLEKLGGITALVELTESVCSSLNWHTHCKQLEKLYKQRQLLKIANGLTSSAYKDEYESFAENAISDITSILSEGSKKGTNVEENIELVEEHIEKNRSSNLRGRSWGNSFLDKFTGGVQKGKTYRIGAPSGVGKTNLIYNVIPSLLEQGAKVMFVSLENSIESTYIKLLSNVQGVNPNDIEDGKVEPNFSMLRKYKDKFVLTDQLFDLGEIKREVLKEKPDVVILDYIGLINIKGTDEKSLYNRYADEVKQFVQKNKTLSWIDLSNLNKDDDEERIRQHTGFNGSAKLKNNIDVGIHLFYYKPFYSYKKEMLGEGEGVDDTVSDDTVSEWFHGKQAITFLISKNRLGPDNVEEDFLINFDEGIRYRKIAGPLKKKWKEGI